MLTGVYFGTVEKVFSPTDSLNISKYQYEYRVQVTTGGFAQVPVNNCIRMDSDGSFDNYNDNILLPGSMVVVTFLKGNLSHGIIIGAVRQYTQKQPTIPDSKQQWKKRYNRFELSIDNQYNWLAKSDSGPYATVKTNLVRLDDSVGENLTLDKDTQTTTLNTKELVTNVKSDSRTTIDHDAVIEVKNNVTIHVVGNVTMTVDGNVNLTCKNLTAKVQENATVECKELKAKASGNAQIEAGATAKVKSPKIYLNEGGTGITTMQSHLGVIDLISGVPVTPSETVFGDV